MKSDNLYESLNKCPVCYSIERKIQYKNIEDTIFLIPGKWVLYRCQSCNILYLDPRYAKNYIYLAYRNYYTHNIKLLHNTDSKVSNKYFKESLDNAYINWRFCTQYNNVNSLGILINILRFSKRKKINQKYRYLPRSGRKGRLLDVGVGNGDFLRRAIDAGWDVTGVDVDPQCVDTAKSYGLNVHLGGIEVFAGRTNIFDCITMNHVIEHTHYPKQAIELAYNLLKTNGMLWIETPNIDSFGHIKFGSFWRGIEVPRHLVLFSWDSLTSLLKDIGFRYIIKKPIYTAYNSMAAKSKAISQGKNPYYNLKSISEKKSISLFIAIMTLLNPKRSEFISIKAYK